MGGTTIKAGTLQLGNGGTTGSIVGNGFQPKAGNQLTLVTTGGVVSSRFARFVDPFATGPGFNTVDLVYERNSVVLEFWMSPLRYLQDQRRYTSLGLGAL